MTSKFMIDLEADVDEAGKFIEGAFTGLFKAEVTALVPIATSVVTNATALIAADAANGTLGNTGQLLAQLAAQTGQAAEKAGVIAGIGSLSASLTTALNAAVATASTAAPAPAVTTAAPAPTPPAA